eukprot:GGOE01056628.1.p1 GENE.GGOE01056628.1~~GGOE01056628.1.p1  ORF type:complete len:816 (+),score=167.01 GGOE01056628.1:59-2506(+)
MRGKGGAGAPFTPSLFLRQLEASRKARSESLPVGKGGPRSLSKSVSSAETAVPPTAPPSLQEYVAEVVKAHLQELVRADSSFISDARLAQLHAQDDELASSVAQLTAQLRDTEEGRQRGLADLKSEVAAELQGARNAMEQLELKVRAIAARQGSEEARHLIDQEKWASVLAQLQAQVPPATVSHRDEVHSWRMHMGTAQHSEEPPSPHSAYQKADSQLLEMTEALKALREGMGEMASWRAEVGREKHHRLQAEQDRQVARARTAQRRVVVGVELDDDLEDASGSCLESERAAAPLLVLQERVGSLEAALKQIRSPGPLDGAPGKQLAEVGQTCSVLQRSLSTLQQRMAKVEARRTPRLEDDMADQLEGMRHCLDEHRHVHTELRGSLLAVGKRLAWLETHIAESEEAMHSLRADAERDRLETKQVDLRVEGLQQRLSHSAEEFARCNARVNVLQERVGTLHTTVKSLATMQQSTSEGAAVIAEALRGEESALAEAREQQARLQQHMLARHASEQQRYLEVLGKHQQQLDVILKLHEDEAAERVRGRAELVDFSVPIAHEPPVPFLERRQAPLAPPPEPSTPPPPPTAAAPWQASLEEARAAHPEVLSAHTASIRSPQQTPAPRTTASQGSRSAPSVAAATPAPNSQPAARTTIGRASADSSATASRGLDPNPTVDKQRFVADHTNLPTSSHPELPQRTVLDPVAPARRDSSSEGEEEEDELSHCELPMEETRPQLLPTQWRGDSPQVQDCDRDQQLRAVALHNVKSVGLDDSGSDITIPSDEDSDDGKVRKHPHRTYPATRPAAARYNGGSSDED